MKPKILKNKFTWVPLDKRPSLFPKPYRVPEKRHPLLWLAPDGNDFYLVNLSEETLDTVLVNTGGFTGGDDVAAITDNCGYEYINVKPNTAVKVEEYDYFYDPDFVLQIELRIKSKTLGCLIVKTYPEKGAAKEAVILWDTLEYNEKVITYKCKEKDN